MIARASNNQYSVTENLFYSSFSMRKHRDINIFSFLVTFCQLQWITPHRFKTKKLIPPPRQGFGKSVSKKRSSPFPLIFLKKPSPPFLVVEKNVFASFFSEILVPLLYFLPKIALNRVIVWKPLVFIVWIILQWCYLIQQSLLFGLLDAFKTEILILQKNALPLFFSEKISSPPFLDESSCNYFICNFIQYTKTGLSVVSVGDWMIISTRDFVLEKVIDSRIENSIPSYFMKVYIQNKYIYTWFGIYIQYNKLQISKKKNECLGWQKIILTPTLPLFQYLNWKLLKNRKFPHFTINLENRLKKRTEFTRTW